MEEGAEIRDSIIMPGSRICRDAVVQYAIVAENAVIGEGAVVGARPETVENLKDWGVAVVASGVHVGPECVIPAKAMIDTDIGKAGNNHA